MLLIVTLSLLCAVGGALLAHYVLGRVHKQRLAEVERSLTEELEQRFKAYVELEGRASHATAEFDRQEREFVERLAQQYQLVQELEQALDAFQGRASVERGPAEVLAVEEVGDAGSADDVHDTAGELVAWEERVGRLQESKQAEVEQQSRVIARLTARIRGLEPLERAAARHRAELEAGRAERETAHSERDAARAAAERSAERAARAESALAELQAQSRAATAPAQATPQAPARAPGVRGAAVGFGIDLAALEGEFRGGLRSLLRVARETERRAAAAGSAGAELQARCAALELERGKQDSAQQFLKESLDKARADLGAEVVRASEEARAASAARRALEASLAEASERARISESLLKDTERELAARGGQIRDLEERVGSLKSDSARRAAELGAASAVLSELKPMLESLASHLGSEAKA